MTVTGGIFLVVGLMHLGRIIWNWPFLIGTFVPPMWLSWIAAPLALYLSYEIFKHAKNSKH